MPRSGGGGERPRIPGGGRRSMKGGGGLTPRRGGGGLMRCGSGLMRRGGERPRGGDAARRRGGDLHQTSKVRGEGGGQMALGTTSRKISKGRNPGRARMGGLLALHQRANPARLRPPCPGRTGHQNPPAALPCWWGASAGSPAASWHPRGHHHDRGAGGRVAWLDGDVVWVVLGPLQRVLEGHAHRGDQVVAARRGRGCMSLGCCRADAGANGGESNG